MSVVAEWVDIVGLVRSSISDYLRWTDGERVPEPVAIAVLVTGTAEAATDSASGEARADPGAVHTQLLDAFVDKQDSHRATAPTAAAPARTLVGRGHEIGVKLPRQASSIVVCCIWEGRVVALWWWLP